MGRKTTNSFWLLVFFFLLGVSTVSAAETRSPAKSRLDKVSEDRDRMKATGRKKRPDPKETQDPKTKDEAPKDGLFLPESPENQPFVTELFRCPDCGYEQDESGFCPDHDQQDLAQVLSEGKNPLEPPDVDGNEDILVDIPLTGLQVRPGAASGTAPLEPGKKTGGSSGNAPPGKTSP